MKLNGVDGISLALIPLPGANHIEIADEFYKRFNQIKKDMPDGMKLDVGYDKTKFVRQSIKDVAETLAIAISLVVLIVFLFFRNWMIAIRPLIDIPVSLIGSLFIMYLFGFSINVLTLLAIVLATGLVVDDGIVVTENVFKKIEHGMDRWKAAFARHEGDHFCRHLHLTDTGDCFHSGDISARVYREAVPRIWHRGGGIGADLCFRLPYAHTRS